MDVGRPRPKLRTMLMDATKGAFWQTGRAPEVEVGETLASLVSEEGRDQPVEAVVVGGRGRVEVRPVWVLGPWLLSSLVGGLEFSDGRISIPRVPKALNPRMVGIGAGSLVWRFSITNGTKAVVEP